VAVGLRDEVRLQALLWGRAAVVAVDAVAAEERVEVRGEAGDVRDLREAALGAIGVETDHRDGGRGWTEMDEAEVRV